MPLYQHLVSLRVHALLFLGTALAMGVPVMASLDSLLKMGDGCEALKPRFSQDTMAAEEAVAEYLIKPMK